MAAVYQYTIRQAHESGKMMIEFLCLPHDRDFVKQLIRAFEPIHIQVVNYDDLWMNDEIALNAASDIGSFIIYRDAKGFYFITVQQNDNVIFLLDAILSKSSLFEKA